MFHRRLSIVKIVLRIFVIVMLAIVAASRRHQHIISFILPSFSSSTSSFPDRSHLSQDLLLRMGSETHMLLGLCSGEPLH